MYLYLGMTIEQAEHIFRLFCFQQRHQVDREE